jgi:type VI secretion system ImpM family protein
MSSLPLLGWYGKLPTSGDFVGRGLPRETVQRLDAWFQNGLIQIRHRTPDWQRFFAWSTPWHCLLSEGVTGSVPIEAHLCASADRVGRLFPLIACQELRPGERRFAGASDWHRTTAQLVVRAIKDQLSAEQFDAEFRLGSASVLPSGTARGVGFGTGEFYQGGSGSGDIMSVLNSGPSQGIPGTAFAFMDDSATLPMPLVNPSDDQIHINFRGKGMQSVWWPVSEPSAQPVSVEGELTNALFLSLFMR